MQDNTYTFKFMAIVCLGCAILVSSAATGLKGWQEENKEIDIQQNILRVTKIIDADEKLSGEQISEAYKENVKCILVDGDGNVVDEDADPTAIDVDDQEKKVREIQSMLAQAQKLEATGETTTAEELRLKAESMTGEMTYPIFVFPKEKPYKGYCIPIVGKGLWSTMYGYLALGPDANSVLGITFYQHGETPGLGGEVDNPQWKAQFEGKKILEDGDLVSIEVVKGEAPDDAKHAVDGLSGATITSRGVETLLLKDLQRYKPYFSKIWEQK